MFASDGSDPKSEGDIITYLSDYSDLSYPDVSNLEDYLACLRRWLIIDKRATPESVYIEMKRLLAGKGANDAARLGELANRLEFNQQLSKLLEFQSRSAQELFNLGFSGKLTDEEFGKLAKDESAIRISWGLRNAKRLPALEFRAKASEPTESRR